MKVLILAFGADTGGQGIRLVEAFRRYEPSIEVRSAAGASNYMAYPWDLKWRQVELEGHFNAADVVHVRNTFGGVVRFERKRATPPRYVIQYHGSRFRQSSKAFLVEQRQHEAIGLASTLDLVDLAPDEVRWLPSPYEADFLAGFGQPKGENVVIAHAPSARMAKHTHLLLEVVGRLQRAFPVELDLIEGKTWQETLRRKGRADIVYDQLLHGYGNNSIEAWGMGIPVVSGIANSSARERMIGEWGSLPFAEATEDTLEAVLTRLVADASERALWAGIGRSHFLKYHDAPRVVERLAGIYREAVVLESAA